MTSHNKPRAPWLLLALMLPSAGMGQLKPVVDYLPAADSERKPLHTVVPAYPEKARRKRVEGEVEVCFDVDREGKTHRVAVRRSTNRVFEKPARDAVLASTYKPLKEGEPMTGIKTCRTFRFTLEPAA